VYERGLHRKENPVTYLLIKVWSETKHDFITSSKSIDTLKAQVPGAVWTPNGVGGVTAKASGHVIKKAHE
jgi:hypothetical protein